MSENAVSGPDPHEPESPHDVARGGRKRIVFFDGGSIAEGASDRVAAYAATVELVGSAADSPTRERLASRKVRVDDVEAEASVGAALEYASSAGIDTVITGVPDRPEDWMRSALEAVATIATAGRPVPALHVLSAATVASGPVVLASKTGAVAGPEARLAVGYARRLGHDIEIITPAASAEDPDIDALIAYAARSDVTLRHRAVADLETEMVVRAASISAVVLGVFDVDGRDLDPDKEVGRKALAGGEARTVIDAVTAKPPHDLLIFFNGASLLGEDEDADTELTDGAAQTP